MFPFVRRRRIAHIASLMSQQFLDSRAVFMHLFDELPCVSVITQIDSTQALTLIEQLHGGAVGRVWQHNAFDHEEQRIHFHVSIIELSNRRLVEVGPSYVELLHTPAQYDWAREVMCALSRVRMVPEVAVAIAAPTTVRGFARAFYDN